MNLVELRSQIRAFVDASHKMRPARLRRRPLRPLQRLIGRAIHLSSTSLRLVPARTKTGSPLFPAESGIEVLLRQLSQFANEAAASAQLDALRCHDPLLLC